MYQQIASELAALVEKKQAAYGDAFGKSGAVMRILYPEGIPFEKLDDALCVVRVLDKLFRIATDRDALGESPWSDIMGYALLATVRAKAREPFKLDPPAPPRRAHPDGPCHRGAEGRAWCTQPDEPPAGRPGRDLTGDGRG
jgi:hypothetical protein